jgi:hypothetical protein
MDVLVIEKRFCGPPGIGNGGYVGGRLAALIGAAAEVTLRRPVPLGRALPVEIGDGRVTLRGGDAVIAERRRAEPAIAPPSPPSLEEAAVAARRYTGFHRHSFSRCFVCGPEREAGDGLRVFPGPVADGMVAAPWTPDQSLAGPGGTVPSEFVWAALDCPGAFALMGERQVPMLLGRITARTSGAVRVGERCVVLAWRIDAAGRKKRAGSALFGADGGLRGIANAV